jgi:hypothetical protein
MTLDDVLDRALAEKSTGGSSQCKTCQLVRDGLLSNEKLAESVDVMGANRAAAVLRAAGLADVPSGDAIRRHLANHVA